MLPILPTELYMLLALAAGRRIILLEAGEVMLPIPPTELYTLLALAAEVGIIMLLLEVGVGIVLRPTEADVVMWLILETGVNVLLALAAAASKVLLLEEVVGVVLPIGARLGMFPSLPPEGYVLLAMIDQLDGDC